MTEQQTPVLTPPVQPAAPKGPKKKRKGRGKTIAGIIVAAAVAVALIVLVWYFVFRDTTALGNPMTSMVYRGSIQSTVEGYGLTKAKDSATITPGTGTILELYVQEGDQVTAGQQLYRMDDTVARDAVADAQETVNNCQKELEAVHEKVAELNITAPHAGNLREVADIQVGDTVSEGTTIAKLVNDTKLRLSLYYSYAYESQIHVGQSAKISIPAVMGEWNGTVEQINKVRFVSPEGAIHFEVVLVLDNPGTLAEGMDASAGITAADGTAIYPYENGKLEYYETTEIKAKASGPVESVNLLNYADVSAGQSLVRLGAQDTDAEIAAAEEALKAAQEKLTAANEELAAYNAVSPIDGTVIQCSLTAGQEVSSGQGQGITIADTSVMTIEMQVDERNIQYISTGMPVDIDYNGNYLMGTVVSVAMTGTAENGVSTFPVIAQVENPDGLIMSNSYANYSFVASESSDCLLVPTVALQYVSFANLGMDDSGMVDGGMVDAGTGDGLVVSGGDVAVMPQAYTGGAAVKPLGAVAVPMPGGSGGGSMGGAVGGGTMGDDGDTGYVAFVKADEAPENAILEPDPTWGCPEGFWTVPVEIGIVGTTEVEVVSGLNEGDEVFIGYENPDEVMGYGY